MGLARTIEIWNPLCKKVLQPERSGMGPRAVSFRSSPIAIEDSQTQKVFSRFQRCIAFRRYRFIQEGKESGDRVLRLALLEGKEYPNSGNPEESHIAEKIIHYILV